MRKPDSSSAGLVEGGKGKIFSYGSNLCWARIRQPALHPSAEPITKIWLPDYQLVFNKTTSIDHVGGANLVPSKKSDLGVWGVVYDHDLSEGSMAMTGQAFGYGPVSMTLKDWRGLVHEELEVYVATDTAEGLKPLHWYMRYVIEGAKLHDFPAEYIKMLEAVPSITDPDETRKGANSLNCDEPRPDYLDLKSDPI